MTPGVRAPRSKGPAAWLTAGIAALLAAAVFAPTLAWMLESWRVHPYYSHGFLLPPVAGWLAWRAWKPGGPPLHPPLTGSDAGLAVIALGIGVHAAAVRYAAYPVSAVGLLIVLLGVALLLGGQRGARAAAFPLVVLALSIPVPMVERLAPPLAAGVAHAAAGAVAAAGVAVDQAGAQLTVGDGAFIVGAPCSGLRSLVALGTVAIVFAGVVSGPPQRRMLLAALALPLALTANWARLAGLLLVADSYGTDRGLQLFHSLSGPVPYFLALAALVAAARALGCDVLRAIGADDD